MQNQRKPQANRKTHPSNPSPQDLYEGVIFLTRKAKGFVRIADRDDEIEVDTADLNTALHGDRVEVRISPKKKMANKPGFPDKSVGEITQIISRAKINFAGRVEVKEGEIFFVPDDSKLYADILLPREKSKGVKGGEKVLVRLSIWTDPKRNPLGEVVEVFGQAGEHDAEMRAMALEKGFSEDFPLAVTEEAENAPGEISQEEIAKRRDFRGITTMTIDPKTAKDFDDALSIETLPGGIIEVGIHIADVSHFVVPGGALDKEAAERGTSVYLVDRTIPMLPERLSNDLCSLVPNQDRLAFSAVFDFTLTDGKAKIVKEWFGKTIIRSSKRFAYEEAQEILDKKSGEYLSELSLLEKIAQSLRREHKAQGAISFEKDELQIILDKDGVPIEIKKKIRGETNKMIEDFMLLANRRVAEFIEKIGKTEKKLFVYRIHGEPNREAIQELALFVRSLGYKLNISEEGEVSPKELADFLARMEETPIKNIVHTTALRSMAKAIYSTNNIGHYGLAFHHYTHFTSPIRRYPDVLAHRLLFSYLNHDKVPKSLWDEYETLLTHASEREQKASEAERGSIKYKQVEFMKNHIGEVFDGIITGITEWGIYVAEKNTLAEGMIALRNLKNDYYTYDTKRYRLVGERTKKTYSLGESVRVKLTDANLTQKTLDWTIVEE